MVYANLTFQTTKFNTLLKQNQSNVSAWSVIVGLHVWSLYSFYVLNFHFFTRSRTWVEFVALDCRWQEKEVSLLLTCCPINKRGKCRFSLSVWTNVTHVNNIFTSNLEFWLANVHGLEKWFKIFLLHLKLFMYVYTMISELNSFPVWPMCWLNVLILWNLFLPSLINFFTKDLYK